MIKGPFSGNGIPVNLNKEESNIFKDPYYELLSETLKSNNLFTNSIKDTFSSMGNGNNIFTKISDGGEPSIFVMHPSIY